MTTTDDQVRVLLELAGLSPTADEFDQLVDQFPGLRSRVERLWALDLGDVAPALVFRAAEAVGVGEV